MASQERTCTKCKVEKPITEFGVKRQRKDGISPWCKACNAADANRYYHENREAVKARRPKDPDSKARAVARSKAWRKNNPERDRINRRREEAIRRDRELNNGVFHVTHKDYRRILSSPCQKCGSLEDITVDHIIPIVRGGRHAIGNLQALCRRCNCSKRGLLEIEWKVAA